MAGHEGNSGNVWSSGSRGGSHGGFSRSNDDDDSGQRGGGSYGGSFGNNNSRRGGGSYGFRRQNDGEVEILRDAIFIQDLPKDITRDQLFDAFSTVGTIKTDDRSGGPKIWIYKDRDTGEGNGRATVTYEDEDTADRAISQYNDQHIDSIGGSVRVQLAQRRPRNDNNDRGGRGGYRGGRSNWDNNPRPGFNSGAGGRWGNADSGSGGRGFSDNRRGGGGGGFRSRDNGGGDSYRDNDDRNGSYRGNRGGFRGASRGTGGASGYSPY